MELADEALFDNLRTDKWHSHESEEKITDKLREILLQSSRQLKSDVPRDHFLRENWRSANAR